ncbi:hypothetical protein BJX68DRAFT_136436 [Aspergillus pseudodeflectus]|uniref:Secreted protein n=1 Tax=Aspergillus pseudodeflectus TaxID=176178 RepID=A0ABR4JYM4_9EURO
MIRIMLFSGVVGAGTITGGRPSESATENRGSSARANQLQSINNNCTDSRPTSQNGHRYSLQCVILASKERNLAQSTFQIRHHANLVFSWIRSPLSSPPKPQLEPEDGRVWGSSLGLLDLTWTWWEVVAYLTPSDHSNIISTTIASISTCLFESP